jgi:hypothetical protein
MMSYFEKHLVIYISEKILGIEEIVQPERMPC